MAAVARKVENKLRRAAAFLHPSKLQAPSSCFLKYGVPRSDASSLRRHSVIMPSLALPLNQERELLGSGFVLRSASGRLYAVTSYHVAGSAGKPSGVVLFSPRDGAVEYGGLKVVSGGMYGVNLPDVSLIELPEEVSEFVRPLEVAPAAPKPGSRLFMWGRPYDLDGFSLVSNLYVEDSYGMKTVMRASDKIEFLTGMCGSPVLNEDGLVAGIYGGRGLGEGDMFAIDARKSLNWLIKNYETKLVEPYVFKVLGRPALKLFPGYRVGRIQHRSPNGELLKEIEISVYRGRFDAERLEELFGDLRSGDGVWFEIVRNPMRIKKEDYWEYYTVP